MSLNIGDIIDGKYRIVRLLGEGGMGSVFEGENIRIHRQVAIKILHSSVAESADAVQRFEREAQAAGRIGSEHIVEVLDLGELPGGDRYMVMEYLDGEALDQRIKSRGRLAPREAAKIVVELLDGLRAAHDAGIVHRDLKPENVYLLRNKGGREDFVKIVDFGISKFNSLGGEFSMTRTGAVMGTPYYLSPEQAKGDRTLDHRADIYAVGVILYEAIAGAVPFDGETFNELLFKIVLEPVKPLSTVAPEIDDAFSAIVNKAMAREPDARFGSAAELQDALKSWLAGQPVEVKTMPHGVSNVRAAAGHAATGIDKTSLGAGLDKNTALGPQGVAVPGATKTHGAWANTNPEGDSPPRARKWTVPAAAAIVLIGVGGFALTRMGGATEETEAAARAQAQEQEEQERERVRLEKLAQLEAEKAQAEAQKIEAEKAKILAEKQAVEARLSAVEQARLDEEKRRLEAQAAETRPVSPRPAVRPAPAPAPSPAPAAKPTGRKFRTDI